MSKIDPWGTYRLDKKIEDLLMPDFPAQESAATWEDEFYAYIVELEDWLRDPINVQKTLSSVENLLLEKHHDYGEDNLSEFGVYGILVRVTDKVARLKNLIDKQASGTGVPEVSSENIEDTWRDLAGYALQALIMSRMKTKIDPVKLYKTRKNRLIRGFCPDCGEGVLIRENFFENRLLCSDRCGFTTGDLYDLREDYQTVDNLIEFLAGQAAFMEQK
jgi:ribosomal protein S27AE